MDHSMHDAKGRELKLGDIVLIPARVMYLSPGADFHNVAVESVIGPFKEYYATRSTSVMLRANDGDDNDLAEVRRLAR